MYGVLGLGAWGSVVYNILEQNGHNVLGYSRTTKGVINETNDLSEFLKSIQTLFIAIPTAEITQLCDLQDLTNHNIIICSKGILNKNTPLCSNAFNQENFAVLSGPNFASELKIKAKTITTIGYRNIIFSEEIKSALETNYLHVELTPDLIGVQSLGILKNIIAIAVGMMDGLLYTENTKAKIITLLCQESIKIITHLGGNPATFNLSCGIGDIFLTCSGNLSRNYEFGHQFTQMNVSEIPQKTLEGVRSLGILEFINIPTTNLPLMNIIKNAIKLNDRNLIIQGLN